MLNTSIIQTIKVKKNQTAAYLGSGFLPVFSTPAMIALMENTALRLISDLPEGDTSVGIAINVNHLKAIPIGAIVHCKATLKKVEGRKYSFQITVTDINANIVGEGTHDRVIVNIEKFISKI